MATSYTSRLRGQVSLILSEEGAHDDHKLRHLAKSGVPTCALLS